MLIIIFNILWNHKIEFINSVYLSIGYIFSMWVNIPCFISLSSESLAQNEFIYIPFKLMEQYGIIYIVFANVILSILLYFQANILDNNTYTYMGVKKQYDEFVDDASELYIIGRDLDFLGKEKFIKQKKRILHLGNKCKLLCEPTKNEKLIALYNEIQKEGVQIRAYDYEDDITNLKGQIKIDHKGSKKAIFMMRSNKKYLLIKIDNQFLVASILKRYGEIFNKSSNQAINQ